MNRDFQICPCCGAIIPVAETERPVRVSIPGKRVPHGLPLPALAVKRGTGTIAPSRFLGKRPSPIRATGGLVRPVYQLLTSRLSQPGEEVPGFPKSYYCPDCREGFVLAWKPTYSPLVKEYEVVPDDHPLLRNREPEAVRGFCPTCGMVCRGCGTIPIG
jgi:hypothetical protein